MSDAYTVLWSKERCRRVKELGQIGAQLRILFGGPHHSQPGFSRFGVKPGDYIYPVCVVDGVLHVLGRMRVKRLLPVEDFIAANPRIFAGCEDPAYPDYAFLTLENWINAHPEKSYLVWSCTDEVAIGQEGTPLRFDIALSSRELEVLRFRSKRGERGLKYIEGGRLTKVLSLQGGVYRLSPKSAALFEWLVGAAPVRPNSAPERTGAPSRRSAALRRSNRRGRSS